jgi:hypothetical protein
MPAPRCRPFTVLDGMILVAATAVGIAWITRIEYWPDWSDWFRLDTRRPLFWAIVEEIVVVLSQFWALALALSAALACLRLRRPRPRLRQLAREPGFAACCVVLGMTCFYTLAIILAGLVQATSVSWSHFHVGVVASVWRAVFREAWLGFGPAVAAVWGFLVVSRTFRPQRNWIDRGGRLLGSYWIGLSVCFSALNGMAI